MEQKKKDIELESDQLMLESLFGKEVLMQFDLLKTSTPNGYFESFPEKLQTHITKNKPAFVILSPWRRMAIAAVFILVVSSTFIFLNESVNRNTDLSTISLQDVSNEEIELYVSTNESIADMDWQTEEFVEENILESNEESLNTDSIN